MLKAGEILLVEGGTTNVHEPLFLWHQDRGTSHVMMANHSTASDKRATPKGKTSTDAMAQRVQSSFELRNFYDQMT